LYPLLQALNQYDKLAVLTSPDNDPARIARLLLAEGLDQTFTLQVAEDLLKPTEKLFRDYSVAELAKQSFNGNDVVLLQRQQPKMPQTLFGFADSAFAQRKPDKGLITKREIRAVSLARLQLTENSIVWDIGAGSGSVGIEAAKIARQGHVYAVEKNSADYEIARQNAQNFAVHNYSLIQAKAPEGLDDWPDPDAIFIGGSGGELAVLIEYCLRRLTAQGALVMNFVTLENMAIAIETLKKTVWHWDFVQLQASRGHPILQMHRMQAENPVWIVTVQKEQI
jgi:precorrin-6Y C5,15-methyltransferase (decarboxylating)